MKTTIIQPQTKKYKKASFKDLSIGDCFIWLPSYKQDMRSPFEYTGYAEGIKISDNSWFGFHDSRVRPIIDGINMVFVLEPIEITFEPVLV